MKINQNNYQQFSIVIVILVVISTVISYFLITLLDGLVNDLPIIVKAFVSVPSAFTVYGLLFWLFDKHLWKLRIFRQLGIIVARDLNGTWEGVIKSSYDEFKKEIPSELSIQQTATEIKIYGKFGESKSVSIHENFAPSDNPNEVLLYYFYRNKPNYDSPSTMAMHEGSTILSYDSELDELSGYYYSGRERKNHGTISLKRKK